MRLTWMASLAMAAIVASACTTTPEAPTLPSYKATLAPGAGIASTGKGAGDFTYDPTSKQLTWNVTFEGLTGPATAAHIHGPADPGQNAGPVVPFTGTTSPLTGTATLTDAQAAELAAGKYYVNVHTGANRGGEIRGQITAN
jgi:Cu/Zn superoxide dismutase